MTLTPHRPTSLRAFTLVELLVVITIIAVLAGIALPVFNKVQEKAKALQDGNNLRQLGVATIAFASDNDGDLLVSSADTSIKWTNLLRTTYVKDNGAFLSPFDKRPKNGDIAADGAPVSYGVNSEILGGTDAKNMDDPKYPSQLILMAPAQESKGVFKGIFSTPVTLTKLSNPEVDGGTHQGGRRLKVVMLDGHVEDLEMKKFKDDTTADGINRWKFQAANQ